MKLLKTASPDLDDDIEEKDDGEVSLGTREQGRDTAESVDCDLTVSPPAPRHRIGWRAAVTYGVLPALAVLLAIAGGFLKWQNVTAQHDATAATESARAAADGTVALLSYGADTVEKDLDAAKTRLTGQFLDSYTSLTQDVVIPGAQQKRLTATATVPAVASISATRDHAVALLFVNQTITMGAGQPTSTASTVRVTLDKVDNRWLISQFDPV